LFAEVDTTGVHVVTEVSLQTIRFVATAVHGVDATVFLVAADTSIAGHFVAVGLGGLTGVDGTFLAGDTVERLGIFGTTRRRYAVVGSALTYTALAGNVVAGVGLTGAVLTAVGPGEALRIGFTTAGVHTCAVATLADIAVGILGTGRLGDTRLFFTAHISRDAVLLDRADLPVGAQAVVRIASPEITGLCGARVVLSTSGECETAQCEQGHQPSLKTYERPSLRRLSHLVFS
jgi:hypothetical protein